MTNKATKLPGIQIKSSDAVIHVKILKKIKPLQEFSYVNIYNGINNGIFLSIIGPLFKCYVSKKYAL